MSNSSGTAYLFNNPSGSVHLYPTANGKTILNADEAGNTWGSVGVYTSNPNSSVQLHVNGSIFIPSAGSLWITGYGDSAPKRFRFHNPGNDSYIDFAGGPLQFRSGTASISDLMTLTTSGNLGIGTTNPPERLTVNNGVDFFGTLRVGANSGSSSFLINLGTTGVAGYRAAHIYGDGTNMLISNQQAGYLGVFTNNSIINGIVNLSSGNVCVGTTTAQGKLRIHANTTYANNLVLTTDDIYINSIDFDSTNKTGGKFWRMMSTHQSASQGQGKFIIVNETNTKVGFSSTAAGAVSIGTITPANTGLHVKSGYGDVGEFQMGPSNSNGFHMYNQGGILEHYGGTWGAGSWRGNWYNNGLSIGGALSKGSGSFDIQHPLHPDNKTKRLVHSFIEGPRCDLVYRGQVALVNGTATVNLDTDCVAEQDCGMTPGTFQSLCANPQTLLQNKTSFNKIRSSLQGNVLTIQCEDTVSTDTIYWCVIAERKDPFIKSWERTNPNGYLVTEYTRENENIQV